MVAATAGAWQALGKLETSLLASELSGRAIAKPIFVSGVARSGSTILTEIIGQHPAVACHHYSDFPMTWTPYWWNSLRRRLPLPEQAPVERAHQDRLMITADSPEAIEEVLWMHFLPGAHKPDRSHVISGDDSQPQFEKFYRDHIRKLLAVRRRQRYLAKNNYNLTRLEYLLKLFPDARFVVPIRDPVQQVASLVKQHRLFSQQDAEDCRVSRQLNLSGHYEFGPLRCPIMVNEHRPTHYSENVDDITWYASQWADLYGHLHERMIENRPLAEACLVVPYEDICSETEDSLARVFVHVDLDDAESKTIIATRAATISAPDYYQPGFTAPQLELIRNLTGDIAGQFGIRVS
ncbi:MAG: sulfotransferase [Gammaproteobacteria bacterium]|nr:sulfotransferase [Gammaproteobacteria bacterium]